MPRALPASLQPALGPSPPGGKERVLALPEGGGRAAWDRLATRLAPAAPMRARAEAARSLAVMVEARLPLVDALDTAARQAGDRRLRAALGDAGARVRAGSTLADALGRHRPALGALFVDTVRVGEASGALAGALATLALYLERAHRLQRKVRLALAYPAVVLAVAVGAVVFLLAVVVPTFAQLFADFGAELPLPTRVLLAVSGALRTYFPLLVLLTLGGGYGAALALRRPAGRRAAEAAALRLPYVGRLYRRVLTARVCRALSTLLGAGVPLVEAIGIAADASASPRAGATLRALRARVVAGSALAKAYAREAEALFPPLVAQMIAVGEETARLGDTLRHAAEHYEAEVEAEVEALTSVIEPVMVVVLGLLVGGILVAIYLPMFDLVNVIE